MPKLSYLEAIQQGLDQAMAKDEMVVKKAWYFVLL